MTQLPLPFGTRHDIPIAYWSWREGEVTIERVIGAHCYDSAWLWWHPWSPR